MKKINITILILAAGALHSQAATTIYATDFDSLADGVTDAAAIVASATGTTSATWTVDGSPTVKASGTDKAVQFDFTGVAALTTVTAASFDLDTAFALNTLGAGEKLVFSLGTQVTRTGGSKIYSYILKDSTGADALTIAWFQLAGVGTMTVTDSGGTSANATVLPAWTGGGAGAAWSTVSLNELDYSVSIASNGTYTGSFGDQSISGTLAGDLTIDQFAFTATNNLPAATTSLGGFLNDVSLVVIPEPSSLALLGLGLGGLALRRRR